MPHKFVSFACPISTSPLGLMDKRRTSNPKIVGSSPTGGVVFPGLHNFFVFDSSSVGMAQVTHIFFPR